MKKLTQVWLVTACLSSIVFVNKAAAAEWFDAPDMSVSRMAHTLTVLDNGNLLIAGGESVGGEALSSYELYDPVYRTFLSGGNMNTPRSHHTATLLPDGRVLLAGGITAGDAVTNTAEIYDPSGNTFQDAGTMSIPRSMHTATLLLNGEVLLAGGLTSAGATSDSAELYDVSLGTFVVCSWVMPDKRRDHTATLLPGDEVLLAGGYDGFGYLNTAVVYEADSGVFTEPMVGLTTARRYHTATLLPDNKNILIAGGMSADGVFTDSTEKFFADPEDGPDAYYSTSDASMDSARASHQAVMLADGEVLIAGGVTSNGVTGSAELYSENTFSSLSSLAGARSHFASALLPSGKVFVSGGDTPSGAGKSNELYAKLGYVDSHIVGGVLLAELRVADGTFGIDTEGRFDPLDADQLNSAKTADENLPAGYLDVLPPYDYRIFDVDKDSEVSYAGFTVGAIKLRFYFDSSYGLPDRRSFRIARLNTVTERWGIIENYELNSAENWIEASLSSLSVYKVVSLPVDTLEDIYVYPNPFKPGDAVYGASSGGGVTFGNLPGRATIRIFNIAGEFVKEIAHVSGATAHWPDAGSFASGVYIYKVTSPDVSGLKRGKFMVVK